MLFFVQRGINFCMVKFYGLDVVSHSALFVSQRRGVWPLNRVSPRVLSVLRKVKTQARPSKAGERTSHSLGNLDTEATNFKLRKSPIDSNTVGDLYNFYKYKSTVN
jgi:hypothetical protein